MVRQRFSPGLQDLSLILYPGNQFWSQINWSLFLGCRTVHFCIIFEAFHKIIFRELVLRVKKLACSKMYYYQSVILVTKYHYHLFQSHIFPMDNILTFCRHIKRFLRH